MPATIQRTPFEAGEFRVEGRAKVSGAAAYAADAARPGMLWAAFVASPMAHARIVAVDARAARAMPGVHAVLTGTDIGEHYLGRALFDWPVLATDVVRFPGQHVVAVAAETRELAAEAARAVDVRYDELPAIFDPEAALAPGAPVLHEHPERYPFIIPGKRPPVPHPNVQGYLSATAGDVDAAFAGARHVFEHRFTTPRYFGAAIEPRATLVWIDGHGIVHVISTNKSPFALRAQMAIATGLPAETIVVEPASIGGDFGAKGLSVDEFACYFLARATGRPVKAVRSYLDDMRSTNVRHASTIHIKTGITADGRIAAMRGRVVFNGGAYGAGKPIPTVLPAVHAIPALPYRIPNASWELLSVYTNTVPAGHVRSPGEPQILFAVESHFDIIAGAIGVDPIAFRLTNAIRAGDRTADGHEVVEPRMVEVLDGLRRESGWDRPLPPGRGRGVAVSMRHVGGGATSVKLIPRSGGTIRIETGYADQGGGALTAVQRVVSATIGIERERVQLVHAGTDVAGTDPGAGGSRVTHVVGNAALNAVQQLHAALAAAGWDGSPASWPDAVDALARSASPPSFTGAYDSSRNPAAEANTYGGYVVDVAVDEATGAVRIENVLFVGDTGTVINPVAHRGQIDGGFIFGLGHTLTEELIVEDGHIQNLSLADYKLPTMRDIPPFHVALMDDAPGPGPFGAKSAGEMTNSAVGPAVANAVAAACGARVMALPVTSERVFALLSKNGADA
ncbi:MAG TPA: xanthine dehydrogenase family protein [Candidatus Lustribacter sp.]